MAVAIRYTLLLIVALAVGWLARGVFDNTAGSWDTFTVINVTDQDRKVEVSFPAGSQHAFIAGRLPHRFKEHNTGEGLLRVMVDGEDLGTAGYVTSINQPQIIVIAENAAGLYMRAVPAGE